MKQAARIPTAGPPPVTMTSFMRRMMTVVRSAHLEIIHDVRRHLARVRKPNHHERAMAVHGPGAGDITYKIDHVAERAVASMARLIGKIAPCRILCEGPGEILTGRDPVYTILVDPVDGTRNLMADLRSAFVLTGVAAHDGTRSLTLQDLQWCIQTEIPVSRRADAIELTAVRGHGCLGRHIQLPGGRGGGSFPWRAPASVDLTSGYYIFLKYLPRERAAIAGLETKFFRFAQKKAGLDTTRVYDDQWLSAAGQLYLASSGRARMSADLRAWLAQRARVETIASHPYDLCTMLIATEAGSPVLQIANDGALSPLAAPLDLVTDVSFVVFVNDEARRAIGPLLSEVLKVNSARAVQTLRADAAASPIG